MSESESMELCISREGVRIGLIGEKILKKLLGCHIAILFEFLFSLINNPITETSSKQLIISTRLSYFIFLKLSILLSLNI